MILQLNKVYSFYNSNEVDREGDIVNQIKKIEGQLVTLMKRFGKDEIQKDVYDLTRPDLEQQLTKLRIELNDTPKKLSNLEDVIKKSIQSLRSISEIWGSVGYLDKQNLQKTFFPSGIYYDKNNHEYLTPDINQFILLTNSLSISCTEKRKKENSMKIENSSFLALIGASLEELAEDIMAFWNYPLNYPLSNKDKVN